MRARTDHAAASMRQGTVHVWQADTATDPPDAAALLSPDEQARAARFRRPADRTRFAASHVALRHILAAYLSPERPEHGAGALRFAVTAQGKPHLIRPASAPDLRFSLSHSGDLALIAITFGREVGVDVEAERPIPDVLRLAERVAAPHEREALRALDEPLRIRRGSGSGSAPPPPNARSVSDSAAPIPSEASSRASGSATPIWIPAGRIALPSAATFQLAGLPIEISSASASSISRSDASSARIRRSA